MTKKQSHRSTIFQAGQGYGNAVLNFMHSSLDEFDFYAEAFHAAGQALAEKMLSSSGYNDLEACPVIFLYRHALELYFKSIVLIGTKIFQFDGKAQQGHEHILKSHRFTIMLPLIQQIFQEVNWTWDLDVDGIRTFNDFEAIVKDLEEIDPGSYTFRYPVDTEGQASVPHHFVVNIPLFCNRMDALLEALEAAATGLREIFKHKKKWQQKRLATCRMKTKCLSSTEVPIILVLNSFALFQRYFSRFYVRNQILSAPPLPSFVKLMEYNMYGLV